MGFDDFFGQFDKVAEIGLFLIFLSNSRI